MAMKSHWRDGAVLDTKFLAARPCKAAGGLGGSSIDSVRPGAS